MTNTTLTDFEPEKVKQRQAQKAEDQKVMNLLSRFTAEMLKDALRANSHSEPEWGDEETWRFYYLDECRRRGLRLLEQLGWPTDEESLYVNLHTGNVQTLKEVSYDSWWKERENPLAEGVWHVIEHWEPYNPNKPNLYRIKYLEDEIVRLRKIKARGKLDSYQKSDVKRIPEHEKEIETEKAKSVM